jgi:hypothetical protein
MKISNYARDKTKVRNLKEHFFGPQRDVFRERLSGSLARFLWARRTPHTHEIVARRRDHHVILRMLATE